MITSMKRYWVLTVVLVFVIGSLMLVGNGLNQAAGEDDLTDSLYGEEEVSPCEALGQGFDKSQRVTIPLNQREHVRSPVR